MTTNVADPSQIDWDDEDFFWTTLRQRLQHIRDLYLGYKLPWVIGYSGGKDSTLMLQLIWRALAELPREQLAYPVYIVGNDTLVEDPFMVARLRQSLQRINEISPRRAADPVSGEEDLPLFSAHLVQPELSSRFWFNVCGRGYPAPSIRTRWCTQRLKIDSTAKFILSRISKHGNIILALGTREEESTTRRVSMRKYALPGMELRRHSTMHQAYVYTPIADVSKDELWQYLIQFHDTPWGDNNYDLLAIYSASDGECPLITDLSRPACGNGRMGCYVCTLVEYNKSLAARADGGEEWVIPLLQLHLFLRDTIEPGQKHLYRSLEARGTNRVELNRQGDPSYRCYTLETRKDILRRVLNAEVQLRRESPFPDIELIDFEELCAIRQVWLDEEMDWEDSLPKIYKEVTGRDHFWPNPPESAWRNADSKTLIVNFCQQQQLPPRLVMHLLEAMRQFQLAQYDTLPAFDEALVQTTLLEGSSADPGQQRVLLRLLESVLSLLTRDWRDHETRLAEVLAVYRENREREENLPQQQALITLQKSKRAKKKEDQPSLKKGRKQ